MSVSVPGEHAYDVKYSVTANIEDALRKFAELKAALEELKRSGGSFDIGNLQALSDAAGAEKRLRGEVDQTSQAIAKETAARRDLNTASDKSLKSALEEYRARQNAIAQSRDSIAAMGEESRAAAARSAEVARATKAETIAKTDELNVNRQIAASIEDVAKAQEKALNNEVQATQRRNILVTQTVQREVQAKQQEAKAYQDIAQNVDAVTKAMQEQDRLFAAQESSSNSGTTALGQFEARRAAETAARAAAGSSTSGEKMIAGPNGELIQPASDASLKRLLADELRRQQSGQGGFNATQFASAAHRAVGAQGTFDTLLNSDLTAADIGKLAALDKELVKIQKDFAGNTEVGLWARDIRQNLSDLTEVSLGVSKDLSTDMEKIRQELQATAKLSDVVAHQSVSDAAARLKILMDKVADPNTATTFRTVLTELTTMDSELSKAAKVASPDFARSIEESRKSLGGFSAELLANSRALDDQAAKLDKVAQRGTKSPFMIKNAFLSLGGTLEAVSKAVDHLGYRFIDLGKNMRGAGGGGGFFGTLLSGAGGAGGFFSTFVGGAIRAVGAITPFVTQLLMLSAAIPGIIALVGALGTGILGLAGALAPLVGMLGIFMPVLLSMGVAFGVLMAAVKPVIQAMSDLASGNTAAVTQDFKNMSPAARQAAKDLEALKNAFKGADIQQPFWSGADKGIKALAQAAGPLKTLLHDVSAALGDTIGVVLTKLGQFVNSPEFKVILGPNIVEIIKQLGRSFYELGGIFSDLVTAASPFAVILVTKIADGLTKLQAFIAKQADNGGLAWFFADAYTTARKLGDIIVHVFGGLFTLMKDFRPLGDSFLNFLDNASRKFDSWAKNTNFTGWVQNSHDLLKGLGQVIGDVVGGLIRLGNNTGSIKFFVGIFQDLHTVIPPFFKLLGQLLQLLSLGLKPVGDVLKMVAGWMASLMTWTSNLIDKIEKNPTGLRILRDLFTTLGTIVVSASVLAALDKLATIGGMAWSKLAGPIKSVLNSLFGTSFGKGSAKDPLGIGAAGSEFTAKLDAAFKTGADTVAAAIKASLSSGGVKAGEEIGTAETAGGAAAGAEMAGGEASGGFIGGFAGWIKGGGFTKLLGAAFLAAAAFAVSNQVFSKLMPGNKGNTGAGGPHALSGALGGAVLGGKLGGVPGAIIGGGVGYGAGSLYDYIKNPNPELNSDTQNRLLTNIRKVMQVSGVPFAWTGSNKQVVDWANQNPNAMPKTDPKLWEALLQRYDKGLYDAIQQHIAHIFPPGSTAGARLNHRGTEPYSPFNWANSHGAALDHRGLSVGTFQGTGFHPTGGPGVPSSPTSKMALGAVGAAGPAGFWQAFEKDAKSTIDAVGGFFSRDIPNWFKTATSWFARDVINPVEKFASRDLPGFFTKTVPHWFFSATSWFARDVVNPIEKFASRDLPNFFTQTVPRWFAPVANWFNRDVITPVQGFITRTLPNFFTQTIPHWFSTAASWFSRDVVTPVGNFITKSIPGFFLNTIPHWFTTAIGWFTRDLITPVQVFITKTLPGWFTSTIPHWFETALGWLNRDVIIPIANFVTKTLPGWFTSTIPHWFESVVGWLNRDVIVPVANFVTKTLPGWFTSTIPHWFESVFGWLNKQVILPVENFVTRTIPGWFGQTIPHWFDLVGGVLTRNVINPVQNFILRTIPSFFSQTIPHWFDSVAGWFDKSVISPIRNFFVNSLPGIIEGAFKSGINWVISHVIGAGANPSGGIIGLLNKAAGVVGVHIPGIPLLASGGKVPGPDYIDHDSVYAKLTPGEFVVRKRAAQALGPELLEWLNHADKHMKGYSGGGSVVGWLTGQNEVKAGANAVKGAAGSVAQFFQGMLKDTFDALYPPLVRTLMAPMGTSTVPPAVAGDVATGIKTAMDSWLGAKDQAFASSVGAMAGKAGSLAVSSAVAHAAQVYAAGQLARYGWGQDQFPPLVKLWNQESGWNPNAVNTSSGAYGIPQALGHGHPYNLGDYKAQIDWGLNYIQGRYGSPSAAWAHEQRYNWYHEGGPVYPNMGFGIEQAMKKMFHGKPMGLASSNLAAGAKAINSGVNTAAGLLINEMNIHNPVPQRTHETLARANARLRVYRGRGN